MDLNKITEKIIGCCIEVHKQLGPGLLESVYESALCIEFDEKNLKFERHDPIFEAQLLGYLKLGGYKLGLLINSNTRLLKDGIKRYIL